MAETPNILDLERRIIDLEMQIADLQARMFAFEHMQVDSASGGGQVTMSGTNVVLRLNSLTDESAQLP